MAVRAKHDRLQSDTRMDVLTMMLTKTPSPAAGKSGTIRENVDFPPRCDSLSPAKGSEGRLDGSLGDGNASVGDVLSRSSRRAMQRPPQHVQVPQQPQHEAATPTAASWHSPRPAKHRPPSLVLESSNGASSLDVKQQICDTRIEAPPTLTQVPPDKRQPLPPTPTTPFAAGGMGNKPSSVSGSPIPDDHSARSVVRQRDARQPVSRKSSFNLFKRVDSKSPLPRDVTASVMSILHRDGHKKEDSCTTDDDGLEAVPADPFFDQPHLNDGRYPDVYPKVHSASTMTMTDERAGLPLSASTTIRDCRSTDQSPMQNPQTDGTSEQKDLPPLPADDTDALSPLSPTIPAPSPLPEDSPHKYGLRDKIDTPEVPQVPEEVNANKMRRKSSGLEIFNEAKSLQSAQSFLNGLSTARRRAESASGVRSTDHSDSSYTLVAGSTSRPSSTRPSSSRPQSTFQDFEGRRKGHNFKSSGFAYTRPLTLAQIKCYRGHARLLLSSNKHAPVECSVCHIDDDAEHFSCSWCAIRMCRYCRKDFAQRGLSALRERIRKAELGGAGDSANSSSTDLPALNGLKKSKSTNFV